MIQNEEVLARKYRIRLRGIDAPESSMPYGKEAKQELTNIVQGKCLRILIYTEDRYGRCVGDVYCNGIFVQVPSSPLNPNFFVSFSKIKLYPIKLSYDFMCLGGDVEERVGMALYSIR